jgi:formylglycine-generating enzyme required for sulfatase activity
MVVIPPGEFSMGDETGPPAERPAHRVRVAAPFALGKYLVTRREYTRFIEATRREESGCDVRRGDSWNPDPGLSWRDAGFPQGPRHPVVCVSWQDAAAYAEWLSRITGKSYRLPTEAEWEYGARGGTTTRFYWGDDPSLMCRYENDVDESWIEQFHFNAAATCQDGFAYTSPVGTFAPNQFGLYDMLGNAFQWVADCWTESYAGAPGDASVAVTSGGACARTFRGGSWNRNPAGVRASLRVRDDTGRPGNVIGFRVARVLDGNP